MLSSQRGVSDGLTQYQRQSGEWADRLHYLMTAKLDSSEIW